LKIKNVEFTSNIMASVDHHLCIALHGLEGSGKTRFIATAPDPIGVVALDRKTRYTIAVVAEEFGKKVFMPTEDFIRHGDPIKLASMNEPTAKKHYMDHVKRVMEACYLLRDHKDIKTVALDTGSQLWEDIMIAEYGRNQRVLPRDRGPVNQMMIDFLNAMTGKHFIITHKAKELWKNDKPTGQYGPSGFGHVGYHATVMCEMKSNEKFGSEKKGVPEWQFAMSVKKCQANALLQGEDGLDLLTEPSDDPDYDITFKNLAKMVYPLIDEEVWD